MAQVKSKVELVDGVWSVVVHCQDEHRLFYRSEFNKTREHADKMESTARKLINSIRPTISYFKDLPPVYQRLSTRKKKLLTLTPTH